MRDDSLPSLACRCSRGCTLRGRGAGPDGARTTGRALRGAASPDVTRGAPSPSAPSLRPSASIARYRVSRSRPFGALRTAARPQRACASAAREQRRGAQARAASASAALSLRADGPWFGATRIRADLASPRCGPLGFTTCELVFFSRSPSFLVRTHAMMLLVTRSEAKPRRAAPSAGG